MKVLRNLAGLFLLFVVLVAGAQVVPVQPAGASMPGWLIFVLAAAALGVAGFFYFKKHPTALATAEADLHLRTAAADALTAAHASVATLTNALVAARTPPAPVPAPPVTITGVTTGPTLRADLRDAKTDPAPVPPTPARNPLSNAPAGYPDTSPGGYPLWYALGGDGKPVGSPVLVYDGNTFGSESEINAYRAAVAIRNLNLAAYQAPAFTGAIAMSSLTPDDWCWIDAKGNVNWNQVLAGDADMFKAQTIHYFYNGLASFNPATYEGPLKSLG